MGTHSGEQVAPRSCAECAKKDAVIAALQQALANRPDPCSTLYAQRSGGMVETYAERCPCNPKNGGSGICGCINGGMKVT